MPDQNASTFLIQTQERRSVCPVACTLDLLGDKWTLLVVRDLLSGKSRFREFVASPERIATNILADRLARLREAGLVVFASSTVQSTHPVYTLTKKGRGLKPILKEIAVWGLANLPGTEVRITPVGAGQRRCPRASRRRTGG